MIIYLNKGQTLYSPGFNDSYFYVVLFGKCRIMRPGLNPKVMEPVGQELNLGWTIGEEILFKAHDGKKMSRRETCKSLCDSCVLGIDRKGLAEAKKSLLSRGMADEFNKIEIVLRGNHMVKQNWKQ